MVQVSPEAPDFSSFSDLPLYYTVDRAKGQGPIVSFCGPSTVTNETKSSSRIQAYIFTSLGFRYYPRLTVTPVSELYAAVNYLLPEHRGDEVRRGLAGALYKYYLDVCPNYDASVAGQIASSMTTVSPTEGVIHDLRCALQPQNVSHTEIDVKFPPEAHKLRAFSPLIEALGTQLPGFGRAPPPAATILDSSTLKQQIQEFIDTETRYIEKLQRLVAIARDIRKGPSSEFSELLPPSLDRILQAHSNANIAQSQGVTALGKALVKCLPIFAVCYGDYFRSRTQIRQDLLSRFIRESATIQQARFANDRLEDLLIEPVQRLPRFTLYIEKILTILPANHPAVESFRKAQDKVAAICSLGESQQSSTLRRLKTLIGPWPSEFQPKGQLLAIAETREQAAPFDEEDDSQYENYGMLILFPGCLIEVVKGVNSNLTAYALKKLLEKPDLPGTPTGLKSIGGGQRSKPELTFRGWVPLSDVRASFSNSGKSLQLIICRGLKDCTYERSRPVVQIYRMCGQYEGRANKWTEEMAKAAILGRAPAIDDSWELRQMKTQESTMTVLFAVSEEENLGARIRLDINPKSIKRPEGSTETVITVLETKEPNLFEVLVLGTDDSSRAHVGLSNFATYLMRILSTIARDKYVAISNITSNALASHNLKILKSLSIPEAATKKYRPPSPTKLLSNFGSIKASFLSRSKSDVGRPGSSGANSSRPGSSDSHNPPNVLSLTPAHTFHAPSTPKTPNTPSPGRKPKRRSSLSDLANLNLADEEKPAVREAPTAVAGSGSTRSRSPTKRKPSGPRERKKVLEGLFQQLNAENELLYERYNSELLGLAKAAKFGEANKALTEKLNTAQKELSVLRSENMELKRRIAEMEESGSVVK